MNLTIRLTLGLILMTCFVSSSQLYACGAHSGSKKASKASEKTSVEEGPLTSLPSSSFPQGQVKDLPKSVS